MKQINSVNELVTDYVQQRNYRVSTIITAFDRADYLYYAIESALSQSYPPEEIIIVDDCSPTDLSKVVTALEPVIRSQKYTGKIHYHRQPSNMGANAARNVGIKLSTGNWLAFLDDDDVWLPHKLFEQITQLEIAKNNPPSRSNRSSQQNLVACLCSYRFLETGETRNGPCAKFVNQQSLKLGNPYCGASGLFVKRSVIQKLQFDESLPCGQDWDMYVRLSQHGHIFYSDKELFLYRRGSHESLTTKAKNLSIDESENRLRSCYKHRSWLGERYFKRRAAGQILSYVFHKKQTVSWILKSMKVAGFRATLNVLMRKISQRVFG